MTLEEIGVIIQNRRRAKGLRLKDIKDATGIHPPNLSEIERGKRPQVRYDTIERYCEALGLELVVKEM